MSEEQRKYYRKADINSFLESVRDASNEEAFEENNTLDESESESENENDASNIPNDQTETTTIRRSTRKPKPTEKITEGKKQGKTIDKQEKEEKNRRKLTKSDFASAFDPPDCQDFSFLLNEKLSPSQKKCQQELYNHFGIKKGTASKIVFSSSMIDTDVNLFLTLLYWKYTEEVLNKYKGVKKGILYLIPLEDFAYCVQKTIQCKEYNTNRIKMYIEQIKIFDDIASTVFCKGTNEPFYPYDDVLLGTEHNPTDSAAAIDCPTSSIPSNPSIPTPSTPSPEEEAAEKKRKKREQNKAFRQKYYVKDTFPCGKKCEDRFVLYSLHFDGVCTSFWGTGTTFEVISMQILNTPNANRADRRFCCTVGVFKKEKKPQGSVQPYISAFHTILQEIVVSGLLGRYYFANDVYYHVRWAVLGFSADTKAHEEMIGVPGKQSSNAPALYSNLRRVALNVITHEYDYPGDYLTTHGRSLVSPESVWNKLHPCSFLRFWNVVSSRDEKGIEYLENCADQSGKEEIAAMKELRKEFRGDKGWKPISFSESFRLPMKVSHLIRADKWMKENKHVLFPSLSMLLLSDMQPGITETSNDLDVETILDVLPSEVRKIVEEEWTGESFWDHCVDWGESTDPSLESYKLIGRFIMQQAQSISTPAAYEPLTHHLTVLSRFSCIIDMMHLTGNAYKSFMTLLCNEKGKKAKSLEGAAFDAYAALLSGNFDPCFSCFKTDSCILNAAMCRMMEYQSKHPKYISWFRPGMLHPNSMKDLKTIYKCHIAFGIAHFAFQDFWMESPVLEILACFDGLSYFMNNYRRLEEAAAVQARLNFFLGKLDNQTYPGFAKPTTLNLASLFDSLLAGGPLSFFTNFNAESSYHYVTANYLSGRTPQVTLFNRLHSLSVSTMFLFWKNLEFGKMGTSGNPLTGSEPLLNRLPVWITHQKLALLNFMDDYRYYLDDSRVYSDVFYDMLERNEEPSIEGREEEYRDVPAYDATLQTALLSCIVWNGKLYHSVHSIGVCQSTITVSNLEYAKQCLAFTVDRNGNTVFMLIVGYYVSYIGDHLFPEAVAILLPTFNFSLVAPWCHRVFVDLSASTYTKQEYQYLRVSLNRIHIDTAIPFPYIGNNLFFFLGCLFVRPERSIHSSELFFPETEDKYAVSARRSERRKHDPRDPYASNDKDFLVNTIRNLEDEVKRLRASLKKCQNT